MIALSAPHFRNLSIVAINVNHAKEFHIVLTLHLILKEDIGEWFHASQHTYFHLVPQFRPVKLELKSGSFRMYISIFRKTARFNVR